MLEVSFDLEGVEELARELDDMGKRQMPYATKEAINATAKRIVKAEQGTMKQVFDRPTRWTLNSMRIEYAKKNRLHGRVSFKDAGKNRPASSYLSIETEGGARGEKGFERRLRAAGYLPPGWYVVPAKGARLDRYGNITRGMHTKILSDLRAHADVGVTSNRAAGTPGKYFVPLPKQGVDRFGNITTKKHTLPLGIYKRLKRGVKAVFIFVQKKPHYKKRLPWGEVAQKTFDRHFEREFDRAFDKAMRTARR
ncbi:MAG: hypothetical protein ACE5GY_07135 [Thermodesulfobacteriota bacterium]